jgi:hypothetical protein
MANFDEEMVRDIIYLILELCICKDTQSVRDPSFKSQSPSQIHVGTRPSL